MENRRLKPKKVSPQYEDAGLFQNIVCNVDLELIPDIKQNNRGDLIIKGFVKGELEIAVTFAGRRVQEVAPLVDRLNAMLNDQGNFADVATSRLQLKVEGAWRAQFVPDGAGFETRTFHLIAAKWTVLTDSKKPLEFGQTPIHVVRAET